MKFHKESWMEQQAHTLTNTCVCLQARGSAADAHAAASQAAQERDELQQAYEEAAAQAALAEQQVQVLQADLENAQEERYQLQVCIRPGECVWGDVSASGVYQGVAWVGAVNREHQQRLRRQRSTSFRCELKYSVGRSRQQRASIEKEEASASGMDQDGMGW
eukprot:686290-Pelagomonas_calceolata.AAC.2